MSNEHEITFSKETGFPYEECELQEIKLKRHIEYPQNGTWSEPRVSNDGKYIGAICSFGDQGDTVYIWSTNKKDSYLYKYSHSKIFTFGFSCTSLSFVIVYEDKPPIHYNIKTGHPIVEFKENPEAPVTSYLSFSFSNNGRFFALASLNYFYIWDTLRGTLCKSFPEDSPKKVIRDRVLISITEDGMIRRVDITNPQETKQTTMSNIRKYDEILAYSLAPNGKEVYYANKEGIYKLNFEDGNSEQVLFFEDTEPTTVFISEDCTRYFTTDGVNSNFWEERKGNTGSFCSQKFKKIFADLSRDYLVIINNISISLQDYSDLTSKKELYIVYLDLNPESFYKIEYGVNSVYVLCRIDETHAALYDGSDGSLIHKWQNDTPYFQKCLQMVPATAMPNIIASKTSENLIQIWDYITGVPIIDLKDFNAYDIKFNDNGNVLVAGTVGGSEIARIWDLDYHWKPIILKNEGERNKNTNVCLTDDKTMIICHSQDQDPIVYSIAERKAIMKCSSSIIFKETKQLYCDINSKIIMSLGRTKTEEVLGVWDIKTGKEKKTIENCKDIELSVNQAQFITISGNDEKNKKMTIWNLSNNDFELQKEVTEFSDQKVAILNDNKLFTALTVTDDREYKFRICRLSDGEMIGELKYEKKGRNFFAYLDMTTDLNNSIILRKLTFSD